jgi:hypothetical protein
MTRGTDQKGMILMESRIDKISEPLIVTGPNHVPEGTSGWRYELTVTPTSNYEAACTLADDLGGGVMFRRNGRWMSLVRD